MTFYPGKKEKGKTKPTGPPLVLDSGLFIDAKHTKEWTYNETFSIRTKGKKVLGTKWGLKGCSVISMKHIPSKVDVYFLGCHLSKSENKQIHDLGNIIAALKYKLLNQESLSFPKAHKMLFTESSPDDDYDETELAIDPATDPADYSTDDDLDDDDDETTEGAAGGAAGEEQFKPITRHGRLQNKKGVAPTKAKQEYTVRFPKKAQLVPEISEMLEELSTTKNAFVFTGDFNLRLRSKGPVTYNDFLHIIKEGGDFYKLLRHLDPLVTKQSFLTNLPLLKFVDPNPDMLPTYKITDQAACEELKTTKDVSKSAIQCFFKKEKNLDAPIKIGKDHDKYLKLPENMHNTDLKTGYLDRVVYLNTQKFKTTSETLDSYPLLQI
eukprot:GHVL01019013.1.p1 GENE.GHVL01019013.1~~GHVL01019013.1.p1  ORF type:complete len:380 (+),score=47.49 GHVL01019013.1:233-1372(+)